MDSNNGYKYGMKSTFSQCLAIAGAAFIQVGVGVQVMCSTIIIGALQTQENKNEWLRLTDEQLSWFGSLQYLCTPLGSILSSLVLHRLGHKNCMIITNIPYIMSQIMLIFAKNVETMYACSILMGLSMGFSGGPFASYIGEVCEPKLRGALMSATNVFYFAGSLLISSINAITKQWRLTVLINLAVPIITIIILFMSPDSPMWLLTKGKPEKAQRSLSKLRGWASHEKCSNEFQEMVVFTSSNICSNEYKTDVDDTGSSWRQLLQPDVLKPFRLLLMYFFFANLLSMVPYIPYLVEVFIKFGTGVNPEWTIAFLMVLPIIGGTLTVFLMSKLGKRFLTLWTLFICSICHILIGLIGVYCTNSVHITSWIILILFLVSYFMGSLGISIIGWTLLSEIFPVKNKDITCSICSMLTFLISFFLTKFYQDFAAFVEFYNTFTIFGVCGLFGCVYFYYYLPETENKTLQEISEFFK